MNSKIIVFINIIIIITTIFFIYAFGGPNDNKFAEESANLATKLYIIAVNIRNKKVFLSLINVSRVCF